VKKANVRWVGVKVSLLQLTWLNVSGVNSNSKQFLRAQNNIHAVENAIQNFCVHKEMPLFVKYAKCQYNQSKVERKDFAQTNAEPKYWGKLIAF
jgi:hypothetical protein